MRPACLHRFTGQAAHFLFGVTQPTGGRGVAGVTLTQHLLFALGLARRRAAQHRNGFLRRQRIGDKGEVDAAYEFFRAHVREQFPDRFAFLLRPQVPQRVNDGCGRQMHHPLFRADPAQLTVTGNDFMPVGTEVGGDALERTTGDKQPGQGLDRLHAQIVAAADGEGQTMALQAVARVGVQGDIGGGIIRRRVHRIRAVHAPGRGKANIAYSHLGNEGRHGVILKLKLAPSLPLAASLFMLFWVAQTQSVVQGSPAKLNVSTTPITSGNSPP